MKNPCILIPSYNESRTIGDIVRKLRQRDFAVFVVDDGSSDNTADKATAEGAEVIKNPRNMGKGTALRAGFTRVSNDTRFDSVVIMDGDDQHDVGDIAHLIRKCHETGADIVVGNRMADTGRMPIVRVLTNRFMSYLLSKISGQRIPDTQCGFRLIRISALKKITLESSNFDIDSEIILKAARAGCRIESVPIQTVYKDEKSRINPFIDTIRFIKLLLKAGLVKNT
jgi:glycosyltransferase involved in cell wall biosynthesis